MTRIRSVVLFLSMGIGFASAQESVNAVPSILPVPQQVVAKQGIFKVGSATRIVLGSGSKEELFAASVVESEIQRVKDLQLKISTESEIRKLPASSIFIGTPSSKYGKLFLASRKEKLSPAMKAEGYFLDVEPSAIHIIAESEAGKFYGVMSLLQLLHRQKRSLVVPAVTIHDFPSGKMRGISDDISRGQISTLENFKNIIRLLARYKLNVYSPYIEDVFAFSRHPLIGKNRGALTPKEVRELDAYAKQYHVEMIPVFETLGHWENILAISEYEGYGEFPGAHTLNVSDDRVYGLLDEMIGELASCFSSPWFNMAADESHDVGLGVNKHRVAQSDIATVHADHYKRVLAILKKHGKKALMYGDVILNNPTILEKIPKEIVFVDWHYSAAEQYASPAVFRKAGFRFLVCPAVWNFSGPFPNYWNSFANIQQLNRDGCENGSMGLLTSNWNDYGGEALRELNFLGYAWTAQCAWSPLQSKADVCQKSFFRDFFESDDVNGVMSAYALLSDPANQYHWNEIWRHPLVPPRATPRDDRLPLILRRQSIVSTMPLVMDLVRDAGPKVKKNSGHLRYLEFVATLDLWFAEKLAVQEELKRYAGAGFGRDSLTARLIPRCEDLLKELALLRSEFERLWLLTNKAAGLELVLERYDRQKVAWEEIVKQLKSGSVDMNPVIESAWIYHPDAHPGERDSAQMKKTYFRKTFLSRPGVQFARLQLIGDTYAKCFVNGTPVGEVAARRSLSLSVEHLRVKMFDIAPFLKDSVNSISIEAENFSPTGSAGVNVYAEIRNVDGSLARIMTDSTWKVTLTAPDNWKDKNIFDEQWKCAAVKTYPNPITKPDFSAGRTSWIER